MKRTLGLSLLAALHYLPSGAAEVCFVPSVNGLNHSVDCSWNPTLWENEWTGFATNGALCEEGSHHCYLECDPVPCPFDGYEWRLSLSNLYPHVNWGELSSSVDSLYLWFCTDIGLSAAEFAVEATGVEILSVTLVNGFIGVVSADSSLAEFLIARGGCPFEGVAAIIAVQQRPTAVHPESWGKVMSRYRTPR